MYGQVGSECSFCTVLKEGGRGQKNDGGLELQGTGQLVRTVQQEIEAVRP